jgi:hypothetical protein
MYRRHGFWRCEGNQQTFTGLGTLGALKTYDRGKKFIVFHRELATRYCGFEIFLLQGVVV